MPRVLIIFSGSGLVLHRNEGAKHRLNCYIDCYADAGYQVSVACFFKDLRYIGKLNQFVNKRAKWHYVPYLFPYSKGGICSLLLKYSKYLVGMIYSRYIKCDVVQSEVDGLPLRFVSKNKCRITDFHGDIYHEYGINADGSKKNTGDIYIQDQKTSIKYSDICITVSDNLKIQLEHNTGLVIRNNPIISCAVNLDIYHCKPAELRISKKLDEGIVLGYCGGLQSWQNIEGIIDITIKLKERENNIFLIIYTAFPINDSLQLKLDKLGSENYHVQSLSSAEVPSYLQLLDAGFLLRSNLVLNVVSSPTKICEYLAAGVPLICTKYAGDYARCVNHRQQGFVLESFPECNDRELDELVSYLRDVKANRENYSNMCKYSVKNRAFSYEFQQLLHHISTIQ